ncbi:hypothetical protein HMPREF0591_1664 [Mycobacterium parascrofulaceum ATCC BAA-614]|uniref:Uncharacterized protein n=1 Tax=Mycobacterium parascrofulaceum ATCC BAA-614 TaxID=525368 RepID=D5P679_9MYCO|nr:DUF6345 domain-containing protein [Mycobacterium parascrofulaceum]EFG78421.1 hypothetical protein HMPREF0591_1664 [Mycobacterium parascrofulaceum ATCC BAA-614]
MPASITVGVGWSTHFPGSLIRKFTYRQLRYAYRSPSFVADAMLARGSHLRFFTFDERLTARDLDGTANAIADSIDLLYVASHGEYSRGSSTYKFILHSGEWLVPSGNFGAAGPSVAVFDTCDLIDLADPQWHKAWRTAGPQLRLVLGFASPATSALDSTLRGQDFADSILAGDPIGPAWLRAVHANSYPGRDRAIAIGLGDDPADADWALHEMRISHLPTPRSAGIPAIRAEVCH